MCAMGTSGQFTPTAFMHKRKRMKDEVLYNASASAVEVISESSIIKSYLYLDQVQYFKNHSMPTQENRDFDPRKSFIALQTYRLLFLDNNVKLFLFFFHFLRIIAAKYNGKQIYFKIKKLLRSVQKLDVKSHRANSNDFSSCINIYFWFWKMSGSRFPKAIFSKAMEEF